MMTELHKQRVRVSFDFGVTVNDDKIKQSGNSEEVKGFDIALLRQFLQTDRSKVQELLTYQIALYMGWRDAEDIEEWLSGKRLESGWEHRIYGPAIDTMLGPEGEYWRETRDLPHDKTVGDVLGTCTEQIFECFEAHYVDSSVEIIEE